MEIRSVNSYIKYVQKIANDPSFVIKTLSEKLIDFYRLDFFEYDSTGTYSKQEKEVLLAAIRLKVAKLDKAQANLKSLNANDANEVIGKFKFYYRGHYSDKYKVLPSALRSEPQKEDYYYREILTRNPNEFSNRGHLERLVKMQHYDCPTRLLDVTSNPLVALYFACVNTGCNICNHSNTGEVLMFAAFQNDVLSFDSDKALILSCIPKFSYEEKQKLIKACIEAIVNKTALVSKGSYRDVVDKLYHEIKIEIPAFKENIDPYDILSVFFVEPLKDNNRIIKQEGAFLICGQYFSNELLEQMVNSLIVLRIKVKDKQKILKELDVLGINEATLFPEVDKVAHYLKTRK